MPFAQTNNIQTFYEIQGKGSPLVLIHGGLVDYQMWQPQVEPFSKKYKVITYDIRGHGQTGGSEKRAYSVQLLTEDLRALLEQLQIDKPVICGLSLGGIIAQAYAATYPADIAALILCDTAVSATLTPSDKIQTYLIGWSLAPSVRIMGARRFTDYTFGLAKLMRGETWFGQNAESQTYVQEAMRTFDTAEMSKIYALLVRFRTPELEKIKVSTLIINGEHESQSVFRHAEYLQKHIANTQAKTIPGAGHLSNMENPETFNERVLSFLKETRSPNPT
jgi:pimeloyl-ACP methyl ester carboxylesterase